METMKLISPYIVALLASIITYFSAIKKSKSDLKALRESNQHEIEKLMQQHKLDLDALERKHEMEKEKMEIEHKHQLEIKNTEMENQMGSSLINATLAEIMKAPQIQKEIGQAFDRNKSTGK